MATFRFPLFLLFLIYPASCEYRLQGLTKTATGYEGRLVLTKEELPEYGASIPELRMQVWRESDERVRVKISDPATSRWEVPDDLLPPPGVEEGLPSSSPSTPPLPSSSSLSSLSPPSPPLSPASIASPATPLPTSPSSPPPSSPSQSPSSPSSPSSSSSSSPPSAPRYSITFSGVDEPFGFTVGGPTTVNNNNGGAGSTGGGGGPIAFDTKNLPFIFKDQYIELSSRLVNKTDRLYGLGEATRSTLALTNGSVYTLWNKDVASAKFDVNTYGSHPFYLKVSLPGGTSNLRRQAPSPSSATGVFLRNSNGMDVHYNEDRITFKVIGGIIDLFIFMGPSPSDVVKQYSKVVGRPAMMPYWSLGFHNCRWGYRSVEELQEVVANYSAAGIPLEAAWADIDYMDKFKDFTLDPVSFPMDKMSAYVTRLHEAGQKAVLIIDPAIAVASGYPPFEEGLKADLFMKGIDGEPYIGAVWPGPTVFPDWLHNDSSAYWEAQLRSFWKSLPIDGAWIDMNEPSNFCNADGKSQVCAMAECPDSPCAACCKLIDGKNKWDFPPYSIRNGGNASAPQLLGANTVPMSATHQGGAVHYNTHNLYGFMEARATHRALAKIRRSRPFVLSRSTFAGSGQYAAHWTGDNAATWEDLQASIRTILSFSLSNIPMTGADICGFSGNTTEELCARWIQLGAFYPFSRNHNVNDAIPQELYRWDSVAATAKSVLSVRYALLPYLYTLMWRAHQDAEMFARPLFVNFPDDPTAYTVDRQFMLGNGLLVTPVLDKGATSVRGYFPPGTLWFSFFDFTSRISSPASASGKGTWVDLRTPLNETQLHVRAGVVIPMQVPGPTTAVSRTNAFHLLVPLAQPHEADGERRAEGELYWDDGEQVELMRYSVISFQANTTSLRSRITSTTTIAATITPATTTTATTKVSATTPQTPWLEKVVVLNLASSVSRVRVNGKELDPAQWVYNKKSAMLQVTALSIVLSDAFEMLWE